MHPPISPQNLKAAASNTTDPLLLLGLTFLAPPENPIRQEISQMALNSAPHYGPIITVLALSMDGANEQSIAELIKTDPENALGYYLQAHQFYQSGNQTQSLASFRKAASCPALSLYGTTTAQALFKALDALNLHGPDRLKALTSIATRMSNFSATDLQPLHIDLCEMAQKSDLPTRREISDLLLALAGHFFATNFSNRKFAHWSALDALKLKAALAAAEKIPTATGYVAAAHALASQQFSWPAIHEDQFTPLEAAQFLPNRISRAFTLADPSSRDAKHLIELQADVPPTDKPAFEIAVQDAVKAATALIDVSLTDPDSIIGSYLKDLPPPQNDGPNPRVSSVTHVELLMKKRPEVFKAALANEKAMRTLHQAGNSDPARCNLSRLMNVATAICCYAADHDQNLPKSLDVLYQNQKYLKDPADACSLLTAKPYIYAPTSAKMPDKLSDLHNFILAYDFIELERSYHFATAVGAGGELPASEFEQLLQNQAV